MLILGVIAAILVAIPTLLYLEHARTSEPLWGRVRAADEVVGTGVYREVRKPVWTRGKAPGAVRLAAFTSLLLGQMILPWLFAVPVGAVAFFDSLLYDGFGAFVLVGAGITGVGVSFKIIKAGAELLARDGGAATTVRHASHWAVFHGLVVTAAVVAAFDPPVLELLPLGVAYSLVVLGQVWLLRRGLRATAVHDEQDRSAARRD